MNLFQLSNELIKIENELIENGGELTPALNEQLELTQESLQQKGVAYGYVCLNLNAEIEQIDAEIKRLSALKKSRINSIERLKETLSNAMQHFGISELKTPTLKVNFRNSESVEVDELIIDKKYCREKITYAPDKKAIKEAIENGVTVVGASISYNKNLQIK